MPLRGAPARIAENMAISATIPLATSQRIVPVKVIDENRRLINHHRALLGKSKVSYTHLIGWAIVKSVQANPGLNNAFASNPAGELFRVVKKEINFGLAIDVAGKNGARSLLVPSIKNAGAMTFPEYMAAFDDLVARGRSGKLTSAGFPGHDDLAHQSRHGRNHGFDAPAGVRPGRHHRGWRNGLPGGISRRRTRRHRIARHQQGDVGDLHLRSPHHSGRGIGPLPRAMQSLLDGDQNFYDEIFEALHVPYARVKWSADKTPAAAGPEPSIDVIKGAAVTQLINAFRVRGHLMADLDPLGAEPAYNAEIDPLT